MVGTALNNRPIRFFANASYDFIKWRRWAYGLTATVIVPGLILLAVEGLNYSIEFTGGTLIQIETAHPVATSELRADLDAAGIPGTEIQSFGSDTSYIIRARLGAQATTPGSSGPVMAEEPGSWAPGASTR